MCVKRRMDMKKGLLLTLAAMATLTLASCGSDVTYIEELPYKEELVASKKDEILKNITTELDNAHYFESYSKTHKWAKNGATNITQSSKIKEFQDDYVEIEMVSECHSKYDGLMDIVRKLLITIYIMIALHNICII